LKAVAKGALRMVQGNGIDACIVYGNGAAAQFPNIVDPGLEILEADGEKPIAHLVVENHPEPFHPGRKPIHCDSGGGVENRLEEWESLHMIPMNMCHQKEDVDGFSLRNKVFPQGPHSGPCINDDPSTRFKSNLETAGIAAIYDGIFSRSCNGAPRPPKFDFHFSILTCLQGLCGGIQLPRMNTDASGCGFAGYVISSSVSIQKATGLKRFTGALSTIYHENLTGAVIGYLLSGVGL